MSSLINRVRELSKSIKDIEGLKATEDEAIGFRTRAEELSHLADQLQVQAVRTELFRKRDIAVETQQFPASQLRLKLEAMLRDYAADRKNILEPSPEWRHTTKNGLESIVKRANQQLLSAWNNHVVALKPPINGGLLRLLARSRAYQTQSRRINELVAELDRLSDRLPSSLEELERPALLARKVRALVEELPEDIPEAVRLLFRFINEETATAVHLTEEAMEWLRENEMLADLRVSWR